MGSKNQKRRGKASSIKIGNKNQNRLAKQGKLNKTAKNRMKKIKKLQKTQKLADKIQKDLSKSELNGDIDSSNGTSVYNGNDGIDEDDLGYFEDSLDTSFVSAALKRPRKIKSNDTEEEYEKNPRKRAVDTNKKPMLPIKSSMGLIAQEMEIDNVTENTDETSDKAESQTQDGPVKPLPMLSTAELFVLRQQKIGEQKQRIAVLASGIMEDPEHNAKKLKELRGFLTDINSSITIKKLTMLSLLELFKDIIPGYRIRKFSEKEKQQSMKKETQQLHNFEDSLLTNYRHYLTYLEQMTPKGRRKSKNQLKFGDTQGLQLISVQCLCDLVATHPHFNFTNNILTVVVPLLDHNSKKISEIATNSIKQVFKSDTLGEVSLEIVRLISRMVKSRHYTVRPEMLETFMCVKIDENQLKREKKENNKLSKQEKMKLSRRDRKKMKQQEAMEQDLQEMEATENKQKKVRLLTDISEAMFTTYFQILKKAQDSVLLPTVLRGLGRFARLISVDYFEDIFGALKNLIESEELTFSDCLVCVQTAFTILSSVDYTINIDPLVFYRFIYNSLLQITTATLPDDIVTLLNCLDMMLVKRRKQVTEGRLFAFIKRLCSQSLHVSPAASLGLLVTARLLLRNCVKGDLLFDNSELGNGIYLPELSEPEHCNAHNTALWEMHLLRYHYDNLVKTASKQLGEENARREFINKSPVEVYLESHAQHESGSDGMPTRKQPVKKRQQTSQELRQEILKVQLKKTFDEVPDFGDNITVT